MWTGRAPHLYTGKNVQYFHVQFIRNVEDWLLHFFEWCTLYNLRNNVWVRTVQRIVGNLGSKGGHVVVIEGHQKLILGESAQWPVRRRRPPAVQHELLNNSFGDFKWRRQSAFPFQICSYSSAQQKHFYEWREEVDATHSWTGNLCLYSHTCEIL